MKKVEVVAAVLRNKEGNFLCVQRGPNKFKYIHEKFEFPGGKIELHESQQEALHRELAEELNLRDFVISEKLITVVHQYPDFELTMHAFLCTSDYPKFTLNEHINYFWLKGEELLQLDWAAADVPIVKHLLNHESRN